ncbi:glycoside hydrolase, partial [Infundibulicybe gibba]
IFELKKQNRNLKVLLSIGGWGDFSFVLHSIVVNPQSRALFVSSSITMLENYGLDGLDIDYEYPRDATEAQGYADLLKELRAGLKAHAEATGSNYNYVLTVAAPCGSANYLKLQVAEMDKHLDFWTMMAYDYNGPGFSTATGHLANVHGGPPCTDDALKWYNGQGLAYDRMVLGVPLYGRSYAGTNGMGEPFTGSGTSTWEPGVCDYRVLPLPGSVVANDDPAIASWEYDGVLRELVSYDDPHVATLKGEYIVSTGLKGSMFWELSGDKQGTRVNPPSGRGKEPQPGSSLVTTVKVAMGDVLDETENCLHYPLSKFDNVRNPGGA